MRHVIVALQVSMDAFIEGQNGEVDWIDAWEDPFEVLSEIDTCILGRGMYDGYERYWSGIAANPRTASPLTGKIPTPAEAAYAAFALRTPHIVLSRTLQHVAWTHTRIVRDLEDIRRLKNMPGRAMHAVGGAALVGSLMNAGLVDELRLVVRPVVLGGGKPLFKDVKSRRSFKLTEATALPNDMVRLRYLPQE